MENSIKKNIILNNKNIKYIIFDPTKNITILVESDIDVKDQPAIARMLMEIHPDAEQVGFVSLDENKNIKLRMAGGEFCGNATMCAGVYAVISDETYKIKFTNFTKTIYVDALKKYIKVEVKYIDDNKFVGTVNMPRAKEIKNITFPDGEIYDVVYLQGISHIIIDTTDINFKNYFENKIKSYCDFLNVESLGIIFYDKNRNSITPLVYVKNADTLYWENSCASGSIAVYEYLKIKNAELSTYNIYQPCNEYLRVFEKNNELYLSGEVMILK